MPFIMQYLSLQLRTPRYLNPKIRPAPFLKSFTSHLVSPPLFCYCPRLLFSGATGLCIFKFASHIVRRNFFSSWKCIENTYKQHFTSLEFNFRAMLLVRLHHVTTYSVVHPPMIEKSWRRISWKLNWKLTWLIKRCYCVRRRENAS